MGLDWRPMNKAKAGCEREFETLFVRLRQLSKSDPAVAALEERLADISISPYETLGAPRVGEDIRADAWVGDRLRQNGLAGNELFAALDEMHGFYVLPLVPACDGLPVYISPRTAFEGEHVDAEVFRAKFLDACRDFIGDLYQAAYESKRASDLLSYGQRLVSAVESFAAARGLTWLKDQRTPPDDSDPVAAAVHVGYAAAKWCVFWGSRGHGLEADW